MCIPPCDASGKCPQDKPAGVTATPSCVLHSSTGSSYCALVCTEGDDSEDAQCGAKASCKKATKGKVEIIDNVVNIVSSILDL